MQTQLVKNIFILFGGTIAQKLITFASLSYYARHFGAEEIAVIPFYYLVTNLSHVVFGFGIQAYIMKKIPGLLCSNREYAIDLIRKILSVAYFSGVGFGIVLFLLVLNFNVSNELSILTEYGVFSFAIGAAFECMNATQREVLLAAKKAKEISYLNVLKSILIPSLIILLYGEFKSDGIAYSLSFVSILSCIATKFMLGALVKKTRPSTVTFFEIFRESWPYYLESGLMLLRRQGDQMAIIAFMGAESLGVYYVAQRLGEMVWSFVEQIDSVITPELSRKASESLQSLRDVFSKLVITAFYVGTPVAMISICLVPAYIVIVTNSNYVAATIPAAILCFKIIPEALRVIVIGRTVLVACNSFSRLKMTILELSILVPLTIFSAKSGQLAFVALSPIISAIVSSMYGYFLLKKSFMAVFPLKQVFLILSCMVIALYLANNINFYTGGMIIDAGISTIIAFFTYTLIILNTTTTDDFLDATNRMLPNKYPKLGRLISFARLSNKVKI
jgi:O-antigen/teichoic acid export membrane protein